MDMVQILRGALERNKERVANVKEDQLDDATHLTEWKVRDLLNHLIGEGFMFGAAAKGEGRDTSASAPDFVAMGPLSETYAKSVDAQLAGWSSEGVMERMVALPIGTLPGKAALRVALLEAVVHGWDLAKATGQDTSIPDELAGPMLSGVKQTVPAGVRPPELPFAPDIALPEGASLGDQLVAYLGRQP